jgi:hypothetical protein
MIDRVHLSIVACFFVVVCLPSVDAYNILVMPATGKSHVLAMAALADGIAARGHSVTILVSSGYKLDRREEEAAGQRGIHYERIDDGIEDYEAHDGELHQDSAIRWTAYGRHATDIEREVNNIHASRVTSFPAPLVATKSSVAHQWVGCWC